MQSGMEKLRCYSPGATARREQRCKGGNVCVYTGRKRGIAGREVEMGAPLPHPMSDVFFFYTSGTTLHHEALTLCHEILKNCFVASMHNMVHLILA